MTTRTNQSRKQPAHKAIEVIQANYMSHINKNITCSLKFCFY